MIINKIKGLNETAKLRYGCGFQVWAGVVDRMEADTREGFLSDMAYLFATKVFTPVEVIGLSHYEMFPNMPPRWRDIHARVLTGEELTQEEDFLPAENRRPEWARWSMKPWRTADGRISGALLFSELIMSWTERDGPPVSTPTRRGFGAVVMEAMTEYSIDGAVDLDYAPSGLIWRLTCPASRSLERRERKPGNEEG